jgi:hypothetical protein
MAKKSRGLYRGVIERIFFAHWSEGISEFEFERGEIDKFADELGIERSDNPGALIYDFRFRRALPDAVLATQPSGLEWIIEGAGLSRYRFRLARATRIVPNASLISIGIPDATPEVIRVYKLDDEQALLAIVRYNRLIDIFLGLATYSLQNHLRTSVEGIGQIEIDELYIGLDRHGCHYAIPVQAKAGRDQIGVVQTSQDLAFVTEKFPGMRCRAVAAQFMDNDVVALFELTISEGDVKIVDERHYKLIPADKLDTEAVKAYRD